MNARQSLQAVVKGRVFARGEEALRDEVASFNSAVQHDPELALAAESAEDVIAAVRFAREHRLRISVRGGGHGGYGAIRTGLMISTRRLNHVRIDPSTRTASFGSGALWGEIISRAAPHGLAPVAGSSPTVGAVGYLLGGGVGPFARSHGFSSDYVTRFRVVTGTGALVTASGDENSELFWALRGGKSGLGIVLEVQLRLIDCPSLYAGSLTFAERDIEAALRGWIAWQRNADSRVTTSAAIIRYPDFEFIPEPLRGRRLLALRFAFPGPVDEGLQLAEPLRAIAPIYLDDLGSLPLESVARIHNDPTAPSSTWYSGMMLRCLDLSCLSVLLEHCGPYGPFGVIEVRQIGAATEREVRGGSAVSGRSAQFVLGLVGFDVAAFATTLPGAAAQLKDALAAWRADEENINFFGDPRSEEHLASAWPARTHERLQAVRQKFDPDRLFPHIFPAS